MMRRAALALAAGGCVAVALVRCGGDLEPASKPLSPTPSATEAMPAPPSDSGADATACAPRGTLVQGAAPPTDQDITALDAQRRLYWVQGQGGCAVFMRRSLETGQDEGLCASEASTIMALSPNGRLGGLRFTPQKLVVVSATDPAWTVGDAGYATTAELGVYPDPPEAGPWVGFRAGTFVGAQDSFVAVGPGAVASAAVAVRFERANAGGYVSSHYEDRRIRRFLDVAPSGDGGVWALGTDINGRAFLVKLTAANTLDTSAAGGFIEIDPGPVNVGSVGVDGAGRAVALLFSLDAPARLVRALPDGRLDASYGAGGRHPLPLGGPGVGGRSLIVERSGALLAGGEVLLDDGGSHHVGVLRIEANGALDRKFGGASAPFLLQPGATTTEHLTDNGGVELVAAPSPATAGCEPEFAVTFRQRGGGIYVFQ